MRPDAIVLHHSLTEDGKTLSWSAIRKYHMSWKCEGRIIEAAQAQALMAQGAPVQRPWKDIGYHFGIERVGDHYEILAGRMMDEIGAHCIQQEMNRHSLGICFVGNFDRETVPLAQLGLGLRLVRTLMGVFAIPTSRVYGHRELATYKSCPGRKFDLVQFRTDLSRP